MSEKAVKFAECMRSNGVSKFPDPSASGEFTIDGIANGSSLDTSTPAFTQAISACKDLEPAGVHGRHSGAPSSSRRRSSSPSASAHNGVPDFPDPANGQPLVDTNRIPSASATRWDEHSQRRDAEVQRSWQRQRGPAMRRKTWALAAAAVLAAAVATGGVVVMSGAKPQARPHSSRRRTLRRCSRDALGDGLPGRDPDLSGAIGRLAVLRDQPGPRDIHQLPAVGQVISQGHVLYRVNDRPVVLLHGSTPAYRTLSAGATGPDVAELNADLVALGYATPAQLQPTSASFGSATTTAVEKLQAA